MPFVLEMSNGDGHVEWYVSLAMRMQADRKEDARQFASVEAAEQAAVICRNHGSAFSEAFYDPGRGRYVIETKIIPV